MIIGNKNTFAVEVVVDPENRQMGYGRFWIQNEFIGTLEDYIVLAERKGCVF